jgi:hypothetical protein
MKEVNFDKIKSVPVDPEKISCVGCIGDISLSVCNKLPACTSKSKGNIIWVEKVQVVYTPELVGSGQYGMCAKCKKLPTKDGHDGCLGTLDTEIVMNACCGHGDDSQAYVQFWDTHCIRGAAATKLLKGLVSSRGIQ